MCSIHSPQARPVSQSHSNRSAQIASNHRPQNTPNLSLLIARSLQLFSMLLCPPRPPRALPTRWRPSDHRFVSLHRPSFSFCRPLHHHHLHYQQRRDSLNQLQPRPSARDSALSSVLCSSPRFSTHATASATTTMDESVKKHYLADSPPSVVRLEIKQHFDKLEDPKLRKYAHYISRFVSSFFCLLCW